MPKGTYKRYTTHVKHVLEIDTSTSSSLSDKISRQSERKTTQEEVESEDRSFKFLLPVKILIFFLDNDSSYKEKKSADVNNYRE